MTDISTSSPLTRQITSRTALSAIFEHAPISRAELARLIGRSAVTYEIEPRKAFVFGADIGGTKIHAAPADLSGAIVVEIAELVDRVNFHLSRCIPTPPTCTVSTLGSQAGLLGAIGIALDRFHEALFEMPGGQDLTAPLLETSA
jgi:hypothetical protein